VGASCPLPPPPSPMVAPPLPAAPYCYHCSVCVQNVPDARMCCTEPAPPKVYSQDQVNRYRKLREMEYKLFDHNMMMGPRQVFPEFFPNDWEHNSAMKFVSKCKGKCGGNRLPGPLILDTKCSLEDFIPQSYCAAWYLKQNARTPPYCLSSKLMGRECSQLITVWK